MSSSDPLTAIIERLAEKAKANELKKRGDKPKPQRSVAKSPKGKNRHRSLH